MSRLFRIQEDLDWLERAGAEFVAAVERYLGLWAEAERRYPS